MNTYELNSGLPIIPLRYPLKTSCVEEKIVHSVGPYPLTNLYRGFLIFSRFSPPTDRSLNDLLFTVLTNKWPNWVVRKAIVIPFLSIYSFKRLTSSLSSVGRIYTLAPQLNAGYMSIMWASKLKLANANDRSASVMPNSLIYQWQKFTMPLYSSSTPFGLSVEPDVYRITNLSSGLVFENSVSLLSSIRFSGSFISLPEYSGSFSSTWLLSERTIFTSASSHIACSLCVG